MNNMIFISYSRGDYAFVRKLIDDLNKMGMNIWIDQRDIAAGQRWDRTIQNALQSCDILLIVLSPKSTSSENVLDELSYAIDSKKRIIPILLQDCEIPYRIARIQFIDFRKDYTFGLQRLFAEITQKKSTVPISVPVPKKKQASWMNALIAIIVIGIASFLCFFGYIAYTYFNLDDPTPTPPPARVSTATSAPQNPFPTTAPTLAPSPFIPPTWTPVPYYTPTPPIPSQVNRDLNPITPLLDLDIWFKNDPQMIFLEAGGPVNMGYLQSVRTNDPCNGLASEAPNVTVWFRGGGEYINFIFVPDNPDIYATVIIQIPAGVVFCSEADKKPSWSFDMTPEGEFDIWIGIVGQQKQSGILYITHDINFAP